MKRVKQGQKVRIADPVRLACAKWQEIADEALDDVIYFKRIAKQAQAERDELAEFVRAALAKLEAK